MISKKDLTARLNLIKLSIENNSLKASNREEQGFLKLVHNTLAGQDDSLRHLFLLFNQFYREEIKYKDHIPSFKYFGDMITSKMYGFKDETLALLKAENLEDALQELWKFNKADNIAQNQTVTDDEINNISKQIDEISQQIEAETEQLKKYFIKFSKEIPTLCNTYSNTDFFKEYSTEIASLKSNVENENPDKNDVDSLTKLIDSLIKKTKKDRNDVFVNNLSAMQEKLIFTASFLRILNRDRAKLKERIKHTEAPAVVTPAAGSAATPAASSAATPAAKPAASSAAKPAASSAAKPAASSAATPAAGSAATPAANNGLAISNNNNDVDFLQAKFVDHDELAKQKQVILAKMQEYINFLSIDLTMHSQKCMDNIAMEKIKIALLPPKIELLSRTAPPLNANEINSMIDVADKIITSACKIQEAMHKDPQYKTNPSLNQQVNNFSKNNNGFAKTLCDLLDKFIKMLIGLKDKFVNLFTKPKPLNWSKIKPQKNKGEFYSDEELSKLDHIHAQLNKIKNIPKQKT